MNKKVNNKLIGEVYEVEFPRVPNYLLFRNKHKQTDVKIVAVENLDKEYIRELGYRWTREMEMKINRKKIKDEKTH